ncbi:ankyrin repeat domain-containing protein 27-like isoform X2 [Dreissena polymorpha]|uniref:ankyrin repeat domain-containing protein 27-like isoform X2 n=1 Tax=Dreissena polymorpha TaxID=45954 RepID=UPI00226565B7|nr:ankyrin repeat domain-containing protein 27-like isoform X2 [Dreissena polymorpha]
MPSLLGEGFHLQVTVTQMMGLCKHVFRNTVKGQQVIGSDKTKENLDQLLLTFCIDYQKFSGSVTPALVDLMSGQVTRAMQLVLTDSLLNYLMNVVHKHLFATITNCMKRYDSNLNKKNRNLVDTRLENLHVRAEYEENLPGSRKELSKLNDFSTPLERLQCLKHVVTLRTRPVEAAKSDDTLHLAALYVQTGLIDILFKNGCLADASDVLGRTPLHMAALKGHQNIIVSKIV